MKPLEAKVRALFDTYGKSANAALQTPPKEDLAEVIAAFAAYVVGSNPHGVMGSANDANFKSMLPQGFSQYRAVGGRQMTIKGLQVTELDHLHAVADVDWEFVYINKAGQSGHITFTNFYFITIADGTPKIFAYVTADEQQAMQDHGLL